MNASTYEAIRVGGSVVGASVALGADVVGRQRPLRPLWNTPKGSYVQSIVNAVWGDTFEDEQSAFRIELGLRDEDGEPAVPVSRKFSVSGNESVGSIVVASSRWELVDYD